MRLTLRQLETIRMALDRAAHERMSYADSWSHTGPEAKKALAQVRRFRALHRKLFGEKTATEQFDDQMNTCESVSIFDLHRNRNKDADNAAD